MTIPRPPISPFALTAILLGATVYWLIVTVADKATTVLTGLAGRLTP